MLKVLFISGAYPRPSDRNMNYFQRVYFLSRESELTVIAAKGSDYSCVAASGAEILESPWRGKAGQFLFLLLWLLKGGGRKMDLVVTEPSILGIAGYLTRLITGCRWVVDIWDIPMRFAAGGGLLRVLRSVLARRLMRGLYRKADLFIVSIVPDFELTYFRLPPEKMLVLPNAIWPLEPSDVVPPVAGGGFSMVCMRSVHTRDMGLDTLAAAFTKLKSRIPGLALTIIGQIPAGVKPQVMSLDGDAQVRFVEFVEHGELLQLLQSCSVCIIPFKDVPDLAQTYPIKLLEYLGLGRPVVVSDIAGMARLIENGVNGMLFRAGNAVDLADKVLELYRNESLRNSLARSAVRYDERFDCRMKNKRILAALQGLTERPGVKGVCPVYSD